MDEDVAQELKNIGGQLKKLSGDVKSSVSGVGFVAVIIVCLLAMISNPQKSAHTGFSSDKSHLPQGMVDLGTEYKSYYLWSITRIRGRSEILTLGLFGNIFDRNFPDDFKEKMSELGK
jgi:hypothetical protein